MIIRDVMSTNVISIPSNTSLADAKRIMDAHHVRRLPVVDRGKLAGVITRDALDKAGPSQITTFSIHELTYLLSKITVAQMMKKDVVTISPAATVEEGVALAQQKKVGALVVVEEGRVVGIATTNDFFYKILNPTLGIGLPGSRVTVRDCAGARQICAIASAVDRLNIPLAGMFTLKTPDSGKIDCTLHLGAPAAEADRLVVELSGLGFKAEKLAR
ncbi:MAG: CBS domain-containing protein [Chloroflexi bacterium]|nr:CBS domain-containing protein [Chloroflexota bacterium]